MKAEKAIKLVMAETQEIVDVHNKSMTSSGEDFRGVSAEEIEAAVRRVMSNRKSSSYYRWAFGIASAALAVLLVAFIGSVVFAVHVLKDQMVGKNDVLVNSKDGNPLRVQQHFQYLTVEALNHVDLEQMEKMESLVLQWGASGSGREKKYYYNVESAFRDAATNTTLLRLSSGHKLLISPEKAILSNESKEILGELLFGVSEGEKGDEKEVQEEKRTTENQGDKANAACEFFGDCEERTVSQRKLFGHNKFGRYPTNAAPGLPTSEFDGYCRYGCGGMAVTFPYYYRPFFGYGFPLVGTESFFPQGYGGYPAAPLLASQAGNSPAVGMTAPSMAGGMGVNPGIGAAHIQGGAVPMSLPPSM